MPLRADFGGQDAITLTELERDALAELANIGVSRAAASLRKMVGQQVLLSVPSVEVVSRKTASALIAEREGKVTHMTSAMQTSGEVGMIAMGMTLKRLYEQGLISKQIYENRQSDGETLSTYY